MKTSEKLIAGLLILLAVVVFFALINYLGGYGAIISAIIVAGLANMGIEQSTNNE